MTRKVWSIVALVIIFALTLVVSYFIPGEVWCFAFCCFGGAFASTIQRNIAKK